MKSNEEIRKTFKIFIDESGLINLDCFKMEKEAEDNARMMELIKDDFFKIFDENPGKKFRILADMTTIGGINRYGFSLQTRKIGAQLIGHQQIEKGALVTPSIFVKTVIDFIIALVRKKDSVKIFLDKEEALKWLTEN